MCYSVLTKPSRNVLLKNGLCGASLKIISVRKVREEGILKSMQNVLVLKFCSFLHYFHPGDAV